MEMQSVFSEVGNELLYIVAYLIKARIVEPEETSIVRKQHGYNM
jgi:hypothetical protein